MTDMVTTNPSFSLTQGTCCACGKAFQRPSSTWTDRCPECAKCPACGSGFLLSYKLTGEHVTQQRCMTCLKFWETDDREPAADSPEPE